MTTTYGAFTGHVRVAKMRGRKARVAITGGDGSGKTRGALHIAFGLKGAGDVAMLSLGEDGSEDLFASIFPPFLSIDASSPDLLVEARRRFGDDGLPYVGGEGVDPRILLLALEHVAPALGEDGVLIIDTLSEVWDGILSRVDEDVGESTRKDATRSAWGKVAPIDTAIWAAIGKAPCHVIWIVRSDVEAHVVERSGRKVTTYVPTTSKMRARHAFRGDVRIAMQRTVGEKIPTAQIHSRLDTLNGRAVTQVTEALGQEIKALLGGEEAGALDNPRLIALADGSGLTPEVVAWYLAARQSLPGVQAAVPWLARFTPEKWVGMREGAAQTLAARAKAVIDAAAFLATQNEDAVKAAADRLGLEGEPAAWEDAARMGVAMSLVGDAT